MKDIRATPLLVKGRLRVRPASGPGDLDRLLALRALCFRGAATGDDRDNFDAACDHILIEDMAQDSLLGGFRLRRFDGAAIIHSYSAQFYDLAALAAFPAPMLELGRFCLHPGAPDADVLRLAWAAITRQVDCGGVGLLFGCSSFAGCDAARHGDAFALLRDRHGAPARWAPGIKAGEVVRFASLSPAGDPARGVKGMPALLRTYLAMGGWVSNHAVIDRNLGTTHVFTGLEIGRVPAGRARLLRSAAR